MAVYLGSQLVDGIRGLEIIPPTIMPYVNSLTFSGTYATSTYFTEADCGAYYAASGRVGIVMRGGSDTSYENLQFTLTDNSGLGITLAGQSVNNYSSAAAGQYYIGILQGVTAAININVVMNSRNSTSDYVTCELVVTLA